MPKVIAAGETITIPAGRMAILPNVQIDGTLDIQGDGEVFIPSGATTSSVVEKVASTDNALVRFNGTTGDVQNSGVIVDDNNTISFPTGARITGDFSNLTESNKTAFQTSTINSATVVGIVPNGTSTTAISRIFNSSDVNNSSNGNFRISSSDVGVLSSKFGTGSYLPLCFYTSDAERMRIDTAGNIGIGVTPNAWGSSWRSLDLLSTSITSYTTLTDPYTIISNNAFISGSSSILSSVYKNTGVASSYNQGGGAHVWRIAPSGTAGSPITWTNVMVIDASGNLLLTSGTGGLGYGTGSGGTVTQLTSKSTAVTLNKPTGVITMNNAALAAGASAGFYFNNSLLSAGDLVYPQVDFDNGASGYNVWCGLAQNGVVYIQIKNITTGSLSDAVRIKFAIIKGAYS